MIKLLFSNVKVTIKVILYMLYNQLGMSFRISKKKKKDGKKMLFLMVLFRTLTAAPPIVVCQLREGYWFSIHFKVLKMQTSNTAQQENAFMTIISLQFWKKQKNIYHYY